jgi:hypothetical protein
LVGVPSQIGWSKTTKPLTYQRFSVFVVEAAGIEPDPILGIYAGLRLVLAFYRNVVASPLKPPSGLHALSCSSACHFLAAVYEKQQLRST